MPRPFTRLLWIATTPIALTFLLAMPEGRGGEGSEAHGSAPATGHGPAAAPAGAHGAGPAAAGHGEAGAAGGHGSGHGVVNPMPNLLSFSYSGKDSHGGPLEPGDHPMPPPFAAALFNFGLLAFLVGKYGGPAVKRYVRERHRTIADALDEAAALRAQARARLDEVQAKLAALEGELATLTARTRAEAEEERKRILADAEAQAARIRRDAQVQIEADRERTRLALEREVALGALAAAERVIRERTGAADQRDLVERFLTGLEQGLGAGRPGAGAPGGRVA